MTRPGKTVPRKSVPQPDGRAERLAAALRENLKRRKARARSLTESQPAQKSGHDK